MTVPTSTHFLSKYITQAIEDGWNIESTPQEGSLKDRSVTLTKEVPELNGELKVLFIDREIPTRSQPVKGFSASFPDKSIKAWFVTYSGRHDVKNRQKELNVGLYEMGNYDLDFWLGKAHFCTSCGKAIPITETRRVYFTGLICANC